MTSTHTTPRGPADAAQRAPRPAARRGPGRVRPVRLPRGRDGRDRRPGGGVQAGALPALPRQARPLPRPARQALRDPGVPRAGGPRASAATTRSASSAPSPPTSSSSRSEGAAFRLVFESDLTSEPAGALARSTPSRWTAPRRSPRSSPRTPGLDDERALMLGSALAGMAQVAARHWLAQGGDVPEQEAARDDQRPRLARAGVVPQGRVPDPTADAACSLVADAGMPPAERGLA